MPTDSELHSRWLPDGRFELTLGKCIPVVVTPSTFFSKTTSELFCLTGFLTILTGYFRKLPDVNLPLETGIFTETEAEFVLADATDSGRYDKLRIPRARAFQERE
jgi:hypothetical protein